jgi:hypothetical protein
MPLKMSHKALAVATALATGSAVLLASPGVARAADATPVSPVGKGTVGGALLGGEVVCLTLAAVGVEKGWPYWVFGGVGMVGGGIGGAVLDISLNKSATSGGTPTSGAEPSLYLLAGGMVLVIPTLVASLNATAYHPPETETAEPLKGQEPAAEPPRPAPGGQAPPALSPTTQNPKHSQDRVARAPHIPLSVVDVYKGKVAMGVPAVEIKPLYSQREVWQYGVSQGTEVKFPVIRATF